MLAPPATCPSKMERDRAGPLATATPSHREKNIYPNSERCPELLLELVGSRIFSAWFEVALFLRRCQNTLQRYDMTLSSFYRQGN